MAQAAFDKGILQESAKLFEESIAINPDSGSALLRYGRAAPKSRTSKSIEFPKKFPGAEFFFPSCFIYLLGSHHARALGKEG